MGWQEEGESQTVQEFGHVLACSLMLFHYLSSGRSQRFGMCVRCET